MAFERQVFDLCWAGAPPTTEVAGLRAKTCLKCFDKGRSILDSRFLDAFHIWKVFVVLVLPVVFGVLNHCHEIVPKWLIIRIDLDFLPNQGKFSKNLSTNLFYQQPSFRLQKDKIAHAKRRLLLEPPFPANRDFQWLECRNPHPFLCWLRTGTGCARRAC